MENHHGSCYFIMHINGVFKNKKIFIKVKVNHPVMFMLGTIVYAMLDIGLSITLWTTKTISLGVYQGYNYFVGNENE